MTTKEELELKAVLDHIVHETTDEELLTMCKRAGFDTYGNSAATVLPIEASVFSVNVKIGTFEIAPLTLPPIVAFPEFRMVWPAINWQCKETNYEDMAA